VHCAGTYTSLRRQAICDRHRDDVANELQMRSLAAKTDVGLPDFRVDLSIAPPDAPARPILAALLDGNSPQVASCGG
jgi:hypothetical protein